MHVACMSPAQQFCCCWVSTGEEPNPCRCVLFHSSVSRASLQPDYVLRPPSWYAALLSACVAAYVYIHTCGRSVCMHQCHMSGFFKQASSCCGGLARPGMTRVHTCSGFGVCVISRLLASGFSVCSPRQRAVLSVAH